MERHWRKLCKDLRLGKLNKHLPVSKAKRTEMESAMLPNPKQAKLLEECLRKLGFHDRASGTKATAKTVNEDEDDIRKKFKKHVVQKIKENEVPATAREHKLPMNMGVGAEEKSFVSGPTTNKERKKMRKSEIESKTLAIVAAERKFMATARQEGGEDEFLEDEMTLSISSQVSYESSVKSGTSKRSTFSVGSRFSKDSSKKTEGSLSSQFNVTDQMRKMTLRDYFTLSLDYDESTDAMNTKFPGRLIRRASESDLRPMSMQNLFKSGHVLKKVRRGEEGRGAKRLAERCYGASSIPSAEIVSCNVAAAMPSRRSFRGLFRTTSYISRSGR